MNAIREQRLERGWSQAELAQRAGISRAAVSAIEGQRLVPSVTTALSLARVFERTVEALFGPRAAPFGEAAWALPPPSKPWRFWRAEVDGRRLLFPAERTGAVNGAHDGVTGHANTEKPWSAADVTLARNTLVMAGCDPAAGIMKQEYQRRTGFRMLLLTRSSSQSLDLLNQGIVHAAGVHFTNPDAREGNERIAREKLGPGYCLIRAAEWEEGIVASNHVKGRVASVVIREKLRWVAREVGSAARCCLDQLRRSDRYRHIATDHRGVAEAIRLGWADAGVCVRLVSEEAGLRFLLVQQEKYDLCFPCALQDDPRIVALTSLLQTSSYRQLIGELPGYGTRGLGDLRPVGDAG